MTVRVTWLSLEDRLELEFAQLTEEGVDPGELRRAWAEVADASPEVRQETAARLLDRAGEIMTPPQAFTVLRAASPPPPLPGDLERRVLAGWTGRMAGCLLGKPVEKIPRQGIRALLESAGRWPLDDYFTAVGVSPEVLAQYPWNRASAPTSLRETIVCMPEDDDLNYTMLNLGVLESAGPDFSTDDVAAAWLTLLPALTTFTAERVAYQNLLDRVQPPTTALRRNPYREWIGAQIRADVWGWVNPGNPAQAAEYAGRDAQLSHVNNGVWGEQYVAAMVAAACVLDEVSDVVQAGLAVIAEDSRLAGAIRLAVQLHGQQTEWEDALDQLHAHYGHYHWVHTINNAALVTAALLYGGGEFGRSICLAVMGGWDTDSNGATVGSVVGTLRGEVPERWAKALGGRVRTSLKGFDNATPPDLARRTVAQAHKVREAVGERG